MKKKTVITIVIAALLCLVLLGADPLDENAKSASNAPEYVGLFTDPVQVDFSASGYQKTIWIERNSAFGNLLPVIRSDEEGKTWHWYISGTDEQFTGETSVAADTQVTARLEMNNPELDFMGENNTGYLSAVAPDNNPDGSTFYVIAENNDDPADSLKACTSGAEGCDPSIWTFEFTGSCKTIQGKDYCYYYVRSGNSYLQINGINNVAVGSAPGKVLVGKVPDSTAYYLRKDTSNVYLNNKCENNGSKCYFKGSDYTNEGSQIFIGASIPENVTAKTIVFENNGGDRPAPYAYVIESGKTIRLPDYSGTRNGHIFKGWSLSADGTGLLYPKDTVFPADGMSLNDPSATLYAIYDSDPIIWFDSNGGADPMVGSEKVNFYNIGEDGLTEDFVFPDCVKNGYLLTGWTALNHSEPIPAGTKLSDVVAGLDSDIRFYANWAKTEPVTFKYKENGSRNFNLVVGKTYNLRAAADYPELDGYRHITNIWNYTDKNGQTVPVDNEFTMVDHPVTLTEVSPVRITFDLNNGKVLYCAECNSDKQLAAYPGQEISLSNITADGRTKRAFLGWAAAKEHQKYVSNYKVPNKNSTLYAMWGCTVRFNTDAYQSYGVTTPEPIIGYVKDKYIDTVPDGISDSFTAAAPTVLTGHDFRGWLENPADTKLYCAAGEQCKFPKEDMTLYPLYDGFVYVSFDKNGGDVSDVPASGVYEVNHKIQLPSGGNRSNYEFAGWTVDGNDIDGYEYTIPADRTAPIVFRAKWNQIYPNVKFGLYIGEENSFDPHKTDYDADLFTTSWGAAGNAYLDALVKDPTKAPVFAEDGSGENEPDQGSYQGKSWYSDNAVINALRMDKNNRTLLDQGMAGVLARQGFDPDKQYVWWYILQKRSTNHNGKTYWHVDGIILDKIQGVVTITAEDKEKIYGEDDPELTAAAAITFSQSKLSEEEQESFICTDGFCTKDLGQTACNNGVCTVTYGSDTINFTLTRAEGENVTDDGYAITVSGEEEQGNYRVGFKPGRFTIERKEITVTVDAGQKKTYGDDDPVLRATAAMDDVELSQNSIGNNSWTVTTGINEDTITYGIRRRSGSDVGTYPITAFGEETRGNYTVKFVNGTFTIERKLLTVAVKSQTRKYGDPDPDLDDVTIDGALNGFVPDYTVSREAGSTVGDYAITASGEEEQGNYKVIFEPGKLTIERRPVNVKAADITKYYGEPDPTLRAAVSNMAEGDNFEIYAEISRAEGETVGSYVITVTGTKEQGNYEVSYAPGTLKIEKRPLTIIGADGDKEYDGKPIVSNAYSYEAYNGKLSDGDEIESVTLTSVSERDERTEVTEIGYDNIPSGAAISRGGEDVTANYDIQYKNGTLTISPIRVKVTSASDQKPYDASPLTADRFELDRKLADGDEMIVRITGSQTDIDSSPNTIDRDSIRVMHGDTDVTGNYDIDTEEGRLTVTNSSQIIITTLSAEKVYDGTPLSRAEYEVTGLVAGDTIGAVAMNSSVTDVTKEPVPNIADGARIFRNGADVTDTYEGIEYQFGSLVVTPRKLTIRAGGGEKVYDGTPLTVHEYVSWGLQGDDQITSVEYSGFRTHYGTDVNKVSNAVIKNAEGRDVTDCYAVEYRPGDLKILARPVTVTVNNFSKEYGMNDPVFTAGVQGTLEGESVEYTMTREEGEEPGVYAVTASGMSLQGSYQVAYVPGSLTINYNPKAYTVEKIWNDDNNRDGVRPVSQNVTLVGSDGMTYSRRLSDDNKWTVTITDLPLYSGGKPVTYTWTEENVENYTSEYRVSGNVTTIIGTHEFARTSAAVRAVWDDKDNAAGTRPSSLTVILKGGGKTIIRTVLSDENNWGTTVTNLPAYENGRAIEYVWYEQSPGNGYAGTSVTSAGTTTLTNSTMHGLTIRYRYTDGSYASADYSGGFYTGEIFTVDSPVIAGCTADLSTVIGTMGDTDMTVTVTYVRAGETVQTAVTQTAPISETESHKDVPNVPEQKEVDEEHPLVLMMPTKMIDIEDYSTALGLGEIYMTNGGKFAFE